MPRPYIQIPSNVRLWVPNWGEPKFFGWYLNRISKWYKWDRPDSLLHFVPLIWVRIRQTASHMDSALQCSQVVCELAKLVWRKCGILFAGYAVRFQNTRRDQIA